MKRLNADVSAFQGALQEAPEVLAPVGVDLPVHVFFGMINEPVNEVALKAAIREERIGVDVGAGFDVFADVGSGRCGASARRALPCGFARRHPCRADPAGP